MNTLLNAIKKEYNYKKLDSTSSFLKRNYTRYKNLTFVSAEYQTKGHGRMGRPWESNNQDNLMFSVLLKDKDILNKFDSISLASAVSIYLTLKNFGLKNVSIKWPNDVYVGDKKITGILLEGVSEDNELKCVIVGIGINVNQKEFKNPNATSYFLEKNEKIKISLFRKEVYKNFKTVINEIKNGDYRYLETVRNNNYLLNKTVYAEIIGIKEEVTVLGINDDNSVRVKTEKGVMNLKTGEITFHKE